MRTVELKTKIVKRLDTIIDSKILTELHTALGDMKSYQGKDFWDDLNPSQKKNIEVSIKQSKEDKTVSHKQVQKEVKQWLGK
jgi:hypothetical protein